MPIFTLILIKKMSLISSSQCIVVSVAVGGWYPRGAQRLKSSLAKFPIKVQIWINEYPPGSPTHAQSPYAFKYWAIKWAKEQGYKYVFWADCSCWFIRNPIRLFQLIAQRGYLFPCHEHCQLVNNWTNSECFKILGVSRKTTERKCLFTAGIFGLDVEKQETFLNVMIAHTFDGSFRGEWRGPEKHRHDMSVGSIEMLRLGLACTPECEEFVFPQPNEMHLTDKQFRDKYPLGVLLLRGM
jgi:hypothetical protein